MSSTAAAATPIWTRRIADEFWSGCVTPLTFALLAEPMAEHMVRRPLRTAGLAALADLPVFHLHASHVYVNAALLRAVVELLPGPLRSAGLLALLPEEARHDLATVSWWQSGSRAAAIATRLLLHEARWAPWQRAAAFDAECARVRAAFAARPPLGATASAPALYSEIAQVQERLGGYLAVVNWGVVFAYVFYHLTLELARRWAPALGPERAALTIALPGSVPLATSREVLALGDLLAREPGLLAVARTRGAAAGWASIAESRGAVAESLQAFLARHGHRLTGRDLLCRTWREAPEVVVSLAVRAIDATDRSRLWLETGIARREQATAAIEAAIGRGPGGSVRQAAFRLVLAWAQRYYVLRENMRYHADFFLARLRALALALGNRLAAAGSLAAAGDVFFLTRDEIGGALADGAASLSELVAARREAFRRDGALPPPETLGAASETIAPSRPAAGALAGEGAAPGRCRGRACVVHGPEDFDRVACGDVLVASYTDPGWASVLELASGLVLEVGGQLSHGAIVARELGIPAVVNVAGATRTIRDGDTVELDADAAVVRIVEGARGAAE